MGEEGEVVDEVLLHEAGIAAAQGVGEGHAVPEVCQEVGGAFVGSAQGCGDGGQGQVRGEGIGGDTCCGSCPRLRLGGLLCAPDAAGGGKQEA